MSESNVFQREKKPFQMLGREFSYEFLPSIHLQEVMVGITNLITSLDFELGDDENVTASLKDDNLLPRAMEIAKDLLSSRVYQVISDVLQHQNSEIVNVSTLKTATSPLEIAKFLDLLISDPEVHEAIATLGKSLSGLMMKLTNRSATEKSTPSSPTTSDSTGSMSTIA
jgi:hypothetical protein